MKYLEGYGLALDDAERDLAILSELQNTPPPAPEVSALESLVGLLIPRAYADPTKKLSKDVYGIGGGGGPGVGSRARVGGISKEGFRRFRPPGTEGKPTTLDEIVHKYKISEKPKQKPTERQNPVIEKGEKVLKEVTERAPVLLKRGLKERALRLEGAKQLLRTRLRETKHAQKGTREKPHTGQDKKDYRRNLNQLKEEIAAAENVLGRGSAKYPYREVPRYEVKQMELEALKRTAKTRKLTPYELQNLKRLEYHIDKGIKIKEANPIYRFDTRKSLSPSEAKSIERNIRKEHKRKVIRGEKWRRDFYGRKYDEKYIFSPERVGKAQRGAKKTQLRGGYRSLGKAVPKKRAQFRKYKDLETDIRTVEKETGANIRYNPSYDTLSSPREILSKRQRALNREIKGEIRIAQDIRKDLYPIIYRRWGKPITDVPHKVLEKRYTDLLKRINYLKWLRNNPPAKLIPKKP